MTRINPDDPKWTAYVLGELDGQERAAVELELKNSEEARMLVEELRFAADLTKSELREALPPLHLTREQREKIQSSAEASRPRRWFVVRPRVWAGLAAAAAAVIALAVALGPQMHVRNTETMQLPQADQMAAQQRLEKEGKDEATQKTDSAKKAEEFELRYEHPALATRRAERSSTEKDVVQNIQSSPAPSLRVDEPSRTDVPNVARQIAGIPQPETPLAAPALPSPPPSPSGTVTGTVQDAAAAVIPGVEVTATNTRDGTVATTVTNEVGAYSLKALEPGNYKLEAALPGFQRRMDSVQVAANANSKKDMVLQVAQSSQSVEVTVAADTVLSTSSASVGTITKSARGGAAGRLQEQQQRQQAQGAANQQAFAAAPPAAPTPPPSSTAPPRAPGVPPAFDRFRYFPGAEAYDAITDNPFLPVAQNPLSTFSIDVDTASYSNVRRFLNQYQLPPRDAVRIEEMINYFSYDYPQPAGKDPIGATIEAAAAPWNPQHRLVRVGIKARDMDVRRRPATNLVFLLDVSGSMEPPERLPLLKNAIRMLVEQLTANDRVTVVTYAGTTGIALKPTRGDQKDTILGLIDSLQAGGSTNAGSGIQLAYEQAQANFIRDGVNRVILATDGDFNVGITDRNALLRLIEEKARSGVFLSVLGVGMGNYKDATLETLADKGHGNYAYLDTLNEARKVLVEQMNGTLITVAKDVKVQVEFNPAVVDAYRLIGYENRALRNEDFNNDLKDAGDMGAGHTVTVLYEVVPRGVGIGAPGVDPLKYQQPLAVEARNASNETLTVKLRYKEPTASDSKLLLFPLVDREQTFARSSVDLRFAAAVASFGMILRDSPYKGTATFDSTLRIAEDSLGPDRSAYRREFMQLIQRARQIRGR
jgi:Ca-activated chloride channel family protein